MKRIIKKHGACCETPEEEKKREYNSRYAPGYDSLGEAILEQAVIDAKALKRRGCIKNGQACERWPLGKRRVLSWYRNPAMVKELVHWFKGETPVLVLDAINSNIPADRIMKEVLY